MSSCCRRPTGQNTRFVFFCNDSATTEIYTLSLHDALPIYASITMTAWLEDWTTKALPASDRKQATIDLHATIARSHLAPKVGSLPLDRLRPSDVEAL